MPFPCSFHFTIYQDRLKMELNKKGKKKHNYFYIIMTSCFFSWKHINPRNKNIISKPLHLIHDSLL